MNTNVEDLLREGMERCTADLRAPAGLMHQAARRRRRRLAVRCSVSAAAVALTAGAVAVASAGLPGAGDRSSRDRAVPVAYVVRRVDDALSAAGPGSIAQMTVTSRRATAHSGKIVTTRTDEWSYRDEWRSVTYSPTGHPVYEEGLRTPPKAAPRAASHSEPRTASLYTLVSYLKRTWARQHGLGLPAAPVPGPGGCGPVVSAVPLLFQPGLPGIGFTASSRPAIGASAVRTAISCGTLAAAGRQRVDGIDAIKLTSRRNSPISETIWVSPGTYLPLRVVVRVGFGGHPLLRQTANITWLPPTAQNLAKLTVHIPAGFRRVPLIDAVRPIELHASGLSLARTGPNRVLRGQPPNLNTKPPSLNTKPPKSG